VLFHGSSELSGVQLLRTGDEVEGLEEDLPVFGICDCLAELMGTGVMSPMQTPLAGCKGRVSKNGMGEGGFLIRRIMRDQVVKALLSVGQGSPAKPECRVNVTEEHPSSGRIEVGPHPGPMKR